MNAIALSAIVLAGIAVLVVSMNRAAEKSSHQLGEEAFQRIFNGLSPAPKLKVAWAYAYPAFEVSYESKAEMERAAPLNAEFRRELDELLKDCRPGGRRFRADMGVSFIYPGYVEELVATFRKKEPNQFPEPPPSAVH